MSSKWRKHVTQQSNAVEPPGEGQQIVQAIGSRGGNLIEVQLPNGDSTLCILPARFNKKLWIKRGGFLIVDHSEVDEDQRITGTIAHVLFDKDVRYLRSLPGVWPEAFSAAWPCGTTADEPGLTMQELRQPLQEAGRKQTTNEANADRDGENSEEESSDDDLPPLHRNQNRPVREYEYTDDETTSDEE